MLHCPTTGPPVNTRKVDFLGPRQDAHAALVTVNAVVNGERRTRSNIVHGRIHRHEFNIDYPLHAFTPKRLADSMEPLRRWA